MKTKTKVFWLFGRSGAGKTTLAMRLRDGLADRKIPVVYLDGDEMRSTLCSDLGYKPEARLENHRRIAEMARMLAAQELNVVVSTMAPEHQQRDLVSKILQEKLMWFYIHAPLDICMQRDPKGLYRRAKSGTLENLLQFPFDPPRMEDGHNRIDTENQDIETCHQMLVDLIFPTDSKSPG